jgi:hypothetical protein
MSGQITTESQYKYISGNWRRYFNRLCLRSNKRQDLSVDDLITLLEQQQYKCALSGVKLTCTLENGKRFKTNASIDRIIPGQPYTKDNIQLVCSALNSWRADTELEEFIWFCEQVTKHQKERRENSYAIHEERS